MQSSVYSCRSRVLLALVMTAFCCMQKAAAASYRQLAAERVITFNDSLRAEAPITDQTVNAENWWWDAADAENYPAPAGYAIAPGINFTFPKGGENPWTFTAVRLGNLASSSGKLLSTQNNLPFADGSYALAYADEDLLCNSANRAGQLLLRNSAGETRGDVSGIHVLSPTFAEGIGRIYFDAVNSSVSITNELALYISKDDGETFKRARVNVIAIEQGTVSEADSVYGTETILLGATGGGRSDTFFRVYLADPDFVNCTNAVQFAIAQGNHATVSGDADGLGMAVLDNLIVSYPASRATLETLGAYDSSRTGNQTLGWVGALSDRLPWYGETDLKPLARIAYTTNSFVTAEPRIGSGTFHYRWRYLTQVEGCAGSNTVSTIAAGASRSATLSGAVLHIPAQDKCAYTNRPVRVSTIILGKDGWRTAIQQLEINGQRSQVVNNGTGKVTTRNADGSWCLRFDFDPAVEVQEDTDYPITFIDASGTPATTMDGIRLVEVSRYAQSDEAAIRVPDGDTVPTGYGYLLASVSYTHTSGFYELPIDVSAAGPIYTTVDPIPADRTAQPGDIEFYYTADIDAPYYEYVDYVGTRSLGVPATLEQLPTVTNRRASTSTVGPDLPSAGHDYFVRLRDGKSALQSFDLEVQRAKGSYAAEGTVLGKLDGAGVWRVLFQTVTNVNSTTDTYDCRFRFRSIEADGTTNYYSIAKGVVDTGMTLVAGAQPSDAWYDYTYNCTTGYILFQFTEDDSVVTMVRADYQNFNGWSDANKNAEIFVGSGTFGDSNAVVGVSSAQQSYDSQFNICSNCVATSPYWQEYFHWSSDPTMYTAFKSAKTPNNMVAAYGEWVYRSYKESSSGYALQLQGAGEGSLSFLNATQAPRGIEAVTYSARLAQGIAFDDFAYCQSFPRTLNGYTFNLSPFDFSNYTVSSRAVMELNGGDDHDGAASLSLVAYYSEDDGCYEARITQVAYSRYDLDVNRWRFNGADRAIDCTWHWNINDSRGACPDFNPKGYASSVSYPTIFLSVTNFENRVQLIVGVSQSAGGLSAKQTGLNSYLFLVNDKDEERLTAGTFGMLTANSDGRFIHPRYHDHAVYKYPGNENDQDAASNVSINLEEGATDLYDALGLKNGFVTGTGRMQRYHIPYPQGESTNWGLICNTNRAQEVVLSIAPKNNTSDFTPVLTNVLTSFTTKSKQTFKLYSMEDLCYRLTTGEDSTGIAISGTELSQWRGDSYNSTDPRTQPNFPTSTEGLATSIVFTTCWIYGDTNNPAGPKSVEMCGLRARTTDVVSIRSPFMDGGDYYDYSTRQTSYRGIGLGSVSFSYTNVTDNVNLLVQICTNVDINTMTDQTGYAPDNVNSRWVTVTNFTGAALKELNGVCSYYFGLHGVTGMMRLALDPEVIQAAHSAEHDTDPDYARLIITEVLFRDEPPVDLSCWWGWNVRTGDFLHKSSDRLMQFLNDGSYTDLSKWGQSVALNCSVTDLVSSNDWATTRKHVPFVQTPTFDFRTNDVSVGAIYLKARRYDTASQLDARITVYGSESGDEEDDGKWVHLAELDISGNYYTNYMFKVPSAQGDKYKTFRLAVRGVPKATQMGGDTELPADQVVRVAFDEVIVAEGIYAKLGFRNVYCIRDELEKRNIVGRYGDKDEQPLYGEFWGVEGEVYPVRLGEEINWKSNITVRLHWYRGTRPWGYTKWLEEETGSGELLAAEGVDVHSGTNLIFRSTHQSPGSVVQPNSDTSENTETVQYILEITYFTTDSDEPNTTYLSASDWVKPSWYNGVDYNATRGKGTAFSAYNILDSVSPGWAWINEINMFGGFDDPPENLDGNQDLTNQYVEVALPSAANLKDWQLEFVEKGITNVVCTFGRNGLAASKTANMASNCVFLVVASPKSEAALKARDPSGACVDGTWSLAAFPSGDNTYDPSSGVVTPYPGALAIRLVRASGVVEHEVAYVGTNYSTKVDRHYDNSPECLASLMNAAGGNCIVAGEDWRPSTAVSLSVLEDNGAATADWNNDISKTPGSINIGQLIAQPPEARKDRVVIYSKISGAHIYQTAGSVTNSTDDAFLVIDLGSKIGTNIVYKIDPWYQLAEITTNDVVDASVPHPRTEYTYNVGRGASNEIYVVASAEVWSDLSDKYGLTEQNRYTDAVIDWLGKGVNAKGKAFANPGDLVSTNDLATVLDYATHLPAGKLTLTEMYWLDMDPTLPNLFFTMGLAGNGPDQVERKETGATGKVITYTNDVIRAYLCISNGNDGTFWAPYVLRSMDTGMTSWDYSNGTLADWSSVNFKVIAHLDNHKDFNTSWWPLRWFVFGLDSFGEDCISSIEIWDPKSLRSPASTHGWVGQTGDPVLYRLKLDTSTTLYEIETLAPTNALPKEYK